MSLTTLRRLHDALGIPVGVTFYDNALSLARDAANNHVLRAIGQPGGLGLLTHTEYPKVYGTQHRLVLRKSPVASIIAVTNAGTALAAADYRLDEDGYLDLLQGQIGSRTYLSAWSSIPGDVAVTYLYGWTDQSVPEELRTAADLIAISIRNRQTRAGLDEETVGKHRVSLSDQEIPPEARRILAAHVPAGF